MMNRSKCFMRWIVLAGLSIFASGFGIAQASIINYYCDLPAIRDLPLSINDSIIAISPAQADYLSYQQYRFRQEVDMKETFIRMYKQCDSVVIIQSRLIDVFRQTEREVKKQEDFYKSKIEVLRSVNESLSKDLRRQQRKNKWAWIGGGLAGVGIGIVTGILIK